MNESMFHVQLLLVLRCESLGPCGVIVPEGSEGCRRRSLAGLAGGGKHGALCFPAFLSAATRHGDPLHSRHLQQPRPLD